MDESCIDSLLDCTSLADEHDKDMQFAEWGVENQIMLVGLERTYQTTNEVSTAIVCWDTP